MNTFALRLWLEDQRDLAQKAMDDLGDGYPDWVHHEAEGRRDAYSLALARLAEIEGEA